MSKCEVSRYSSISCFIAIILSLCDTLIGDGKYYLGALTKASVISWVRKYVTKFS